MTRLGSQMEDVSEQEVRTRLVEAYVATQSGTLRTIFKVKMEDMSHARVEILLYVLRNAKQSVRRRPFFSAKMLHHCDTFSANTSGRRP